jgi:type I restriction enzyme S subunit
MKFNDIPFSDLLSKVIDNRGKTCPTADSGIPLIATNCIRNDLLYPAYEKVRYVSQETYDSWFRGHPQPGDMIFVTKGSPGRVCWVPDPIDFCIAQDMVAIRADESKVHPKYLFALLRTTETQFKIGNMHVGTLIPHFKKGDFDKLILTIPEDLDYQKEVGEKYFDFCEKIELNRQINQTLEQIAQAIFKSWFVDFEPVKAKIEAKAADRDPERAAMCAISGKLEPELDQISPEQYQQLAATAALFPDELVESELGMIPEGWEVKSLPVAIEVNPSRTLKKGAVAPYLDMANVPTNSARVADVIQREFSSGSKFMNGDTLLARITPCLENGKTAYVDFLAEKQVGWGSTEFIVFRPKAPLPEAFGYLLCRHPDFRAFAIANMSGTSGRQRVPNDCFANYKLAIPSSGVASSFGETVAGIMDGIKTRDEEARTLATLRDLLLPRLLNGEMI